MHNENDIKSLKYLILQWLRGTIALYIVTLLKTWCVWEHHHDNTLARTFNAVHYNFPAKHNSPHSCFYLRTLWSIRLFVFPIKKKNKKTGIL